MKADHATLARCHVTEAGTTAGVHCANLRCLPVAVRHRQFNHVIMNLPYFDLANEAAAQDAGRTHRPRTYMVVVQIPSSGRGAFRPTATAILPDERVCNHDADDYTLLLACISHHG